MDRDTAEKIINLLTSIDQPANRVLELLNTMEGDSVKPMRKAVRKIGIDLYSDVMLPIFQIYPDLEKEDLYK